MTYAIPHCKYNLETRIREGNMFFSNKANTYFLLYSFHEINMPTSYKIYMCTFECWIVQMTSSLRILKNQYRDAMASN